MEAATLAGLIVSLPDVRQTETPEGMEFQVSGQVFATLGETGRLMLKLTPEQLAEMARAEPDTFRPLSGGWGAVGWAVANIGTLDEASAYAAAMVAWSNVTPDKRGRRALRRS